MAESTQIDEDVNMFFIIQSKYNSENDCNDDMWSAYNKCKEDGYAPQWITEKYCMNLKPAKRDVFVFEEFKGDAFKKLQPFKCAIIGPKCLLTCFINGEPIPEGTSPIFNTAMRNIVAAISGFRGEKKENIQNMVQYMGGNTVKDLRFCTTHLITNSVMSEKYEKAIEQKIPTYTEEWIYAVWQTNLQKYIKATDESFDKYKTPIFLNLIATSTNTSKTIKDELKILINQNGGTYMGPLDGSKVKVVFAPEKPALSDKLKFAMQQGLPCLKVEWVYASIKAGYALPFNNYLIKSTKATSTPEKTVATDCLEVSSISNIGNEIYNNHVEETLMVTMNATSRLSSISAPTDDSYIKILDKLFLSDAKMAGPFLDGCNIYLTGFLSSHRDRINRILNVGSATRLDDISDALTHVIVGDESKSNNDLRLIKSKGLSSPYILDLRWIEESIKLKRPAPEENFFYKDKINSKQKPEEPPSPLSKKNLQLLQAPPKKPARLSFEEAKSSKPLEQDADFLQQYLHKTAPNTNQLPEFNCSKWNPYESGYNTSVMRKEESSHRDQGTLLNNISVNNSMPTESQDTISRTIFEGLTFLLADFDKEMYSSLLTTINELGGKVVSTAFSDVPDYGVVPLNGATLKHTVNEIVTDLFIKDCLNEECIVETMYYHHPINIKLGTNPLSECVITLSTYTGVERVYLSKLAELLGARCQDTFARRTNKERNSYGSTHLVCPVPEGSKYNAAVKWKLPAITAKWLLACAEQLKLVDEKDFLVGETIAPERPTRKHNEEESTIKEMRPPLAPTERSSTVPKRLLPKDEGSTPCASPIINKRLSHLTNHLAQSPFHVSTPDTPYGQVFKDNPSPATRKGWIEWIDSFPDIQEHGPPPKKKRLSTPLSELKRQLWEKIKAPISSEKRRDVDNKTMSDNNLNVSTFEHQPEEQEAGNKNNDTDDTTANIPINRKLDFAEDESPAQANQINLQLAQLQQALQRTNSTPENRKSICEEIAHKYTEPDDQIQKYMSKDTQPDTVGWEDPRHRAPIRLFAEKEESASSNNETNNSDDSHEENIENQEKLIDNQDYFVVKQVEELEMPPTRKFMLSGVKDRTAYEEAILMLGGEVSTEANFDNSATHLLCIRPSRNEKMLGSIASGKWVLHCMYLRDSKQKGHFLDEEEYEWGNIKSLGRIPNPEGDMENAIAAAAYRWRLKLLHEPGGAFKNMVALLIGASEKYDQLKRLIEAGGGEVVQARPPYDPSPSGRKITHCFVHQKQSQTVEWAMLASKNILCFMPQYLSDLLTIENHDSPKKCVHPEFKKYLALLPK
ncbi:DNA topoisomerase 2-binding protein 1 [Prorops nasuta]|uniref:DNA topoisomerase 2-binding protein 1 n=1 Tax=Prorops nasuta TaxID=863751 RepID=UPI0034CE8E9E